MNNTEKKYLWLLKHLIWNASKPSGNNFWVKITPEEASILKNSYEVVETRTLKDGIKVDMIKIGDNNLVLDIR